ncbi:hypothetical protein A4G18_02920 [Pasteurellaceae bacterium Pebbles2]|nr:hypothetical protein [Pasteurellaceae bacterium Pebbles2]
MIENNTINYSETIVIGAGAAGLFCAAHIGKAGKQVTLFDNGKKIGRKILMAGGGFCNFTNLDVRPSHYLSQNPHFVKSALARFTQWDFISLVCEYGIAYHEKGESGQLFCDNSAQDIVDLLAQECAKGKVNIQLRQQIDRVEQVENDTKVRFKIHANGQVWACQNLVIATGGLSMPALGATPFGYKISEQFGLNVIAPRASLVPFTYRETDKIYTALSGVSLDVNVSAGKTHFRGDMLFTHRGLSGPTILQISNYWQANDSVEIDLLPSENLAEILAEWKKQSPNQQLKNALAQVLPKRLVDLWLEHNLLKFGHKSLAQLSNVEIVELVQFVHHWQFQPNGTEGYRTAEVTMGGVDTREISSKTMESQQHSGLYFIGEVLDVTGWLGGYNFQWAWSSAYACATAIGQNAD